MNIPGGSVFFSFRLLLLLVILVVSADARAVILDPPSLRCASVNLDGDVTLTWVSPPDPGNDFQEYQVFAADVAAGPYTQIGTIGDLAQFTFFHAGAGAMGGSKFYYMTTVSSSPPPNISISSDTLATIFLQVAQSAPLGNAVLTWTTPTILPSSSSEISVWMEYPLFNWTFLGNVPSTATSYSHPVSVCNDSLTFLVSLGDAQGCVSNSSRDGDIYEDATPPTAPFVSSVSVDTLTGLANITWDPTPEADTDGYIIVLITPGGGVVLDTVYGHMNTSYEWSWSTPEIGPESYTVAAFDTCWTGDPASPNTSSTRPAHTTMLLNTGYNQCASRVFLEWTPYVGWDVSTYEILVQVDGGAWTPLIALAGDQTAYSYLVEPDRYYCYLVKAVEGPGLAISFSNEACRMAEYPTVPAFNYLRLVTVTAPDQIMIVDSVDMNAQVSLYTLERSKNGGTWETIATAGGDAGPVIIFMDDDVEPATVGYRYRVNARDSCGGASITSNLGGNIILRATPDLHNFNRLEWNGYEDWAGAPVAYEIHRSVANEPMELLAAAPPQPWIYDDDVKNMLETTGKFCYKVHAIEAGNPSGINAISVSNLACAIQEELVYIPNAFVVGGVNNLFIPVIGYADVSQYEFSILNRWGQMIWSTNDREEGWDGSIGSQVMPTGVYAYYCSFHNGAGRRFEKRGIVTLLTAVGN